MNDNVFSYLNISGVECDVFDFRINRMIELDNALNRFYRIGTGYNDRICDNIN